MIFKYISVQGFLPVVPVHVTRLPMYSLQYIYHIFHPESLDFLSVSIKNYHDLTTHERRLASIHGEASRIRHFLDDGFSFSL